MKANLFADENFGKMAPKTPGHGATHNGDAARPAQTPTVPVALQPQESDTFHLVNSSGDPVEKMVALLLLRDTPGVACHLEVVWLRKRFGARNVQQLSRLDRFFDGRAVSSDG